MKIFLDWWRQPGEHKNCPGKNNEGVIKMTVFEGIANKIRNGKEATRRLSMGFRSLKIYSTKSKDRPVKQVLLKINHMMAPFVMHMSG